MTQIQDYFKPFFLAQDQKIEQVETLLADQIRIIEQQGKTIEQLISDIDSMKFPQKCLSKPYQATTKT